MPGLSHGLDPRSVAHGSKAVVQPARLLEGVDDGGAWHVDAHWSSDLEGVRAFAAGCGWTHRVPREDAGLAARAAGVRARLEDVAEAVGLEDAGPVGVR